MANSDGSTDSVDPLLEEAAKFIRDAGVASTAGLQSQFYLGHPRAVRLMKQLEDRQVVGPYVPGEGRRILAIDSDRTREP